MKKFKPFAVIDFIIKIFNYIGYWRPDYFDRNILMKNLYLLWTFIFTSWYLEAFIVTQVVACYYYWPQFNRLSAAIVIIMTNSTHALKLFSLRMHQHSIKKNIQYFRKTVNDDDPINEDVNYLIQSCEKIACRDLSLYESVATITVLGFACMGDAFDEPWGLPFVAWYPFRIDYSPMFHIIYVYQITIGWVAATTSVLVDMFSTNICCQVCLQFDLITLKLKNIENGLRIQKNNKNNELNLLSDDVINDRLIEIIERHFDLIEICKTLNSSIGWTVFAQFNLSSIIICLAIYLIVTTDSETNIYGHYGYLMSMIFQIFLYCYHGDRIIVKSKVFCDAIGNVSWYLYTLRNRRSLLRLMQVAQRPIIIYAGGIIPLSLATFISIIRGSFSFFSVIKNIK